MKKVTLIPGDGTGTELTAVTEKVISALDTGIEFEKVEAGSDYIDKHGTPLPDSVIESIKKNKIALKGPITTPIGSGFRSVNVELRKRLDLYACVRPCKYYPGVKAMFDDVDLVFVRENTEDLYVGVEFDVGSPEAEEIIKMSGGKIREKSAISIKPISALGSARVVRYAFKYAVENKRKKVTAVTKANIMKYTDGLFFAAAREVAKEFPGIEYEERLVDNMCMQLVQKPQLYDVIVLPNLYGDILTDLGAGLVGGLGVAPGANIGDDYALFEPTHGSAPKYKGQDKVNPTALLLSAKLMLEYMGMKDKASTLENAIKKVLAEKKTVTYDLGGSAKMSEMGDAIISAFKG